MVKGVGGKRLRARISVPAEKGFPSRKSSTSWGFMMSEKLILLLP
jgi:hypothetical protein